MGQYDTHSSVVWKLLQGVISLKIWNQDFLDDGP